LSVGLSDISSRRVQFFAPSSKVVGLSAKQDRIKQAGDGIPHPAVLIYLSQW